jgi:hypothetical protein
MSLHIWPANVPHDTYKTGSLPHSLTLEQITTRLGFTPNHADDREKVTHCWHFTVNDAPCAIWDYRGAKWSVYDPNCVLDLVFPPR